MRSLFSVCGVAVVGTVLAMTGCGGGAAPPPPATAPGPFSVAVGAAANGTVELSWSPSDGATAYDVGHGRTAAAPSTSVSTVSGTRARVSGLNNGFEYHFQVTATNAAGRQDAESVVRARPMYTPTVRYTCVRNFYVATDGNDANDGTDPARALATLDAAAARPDLRAGDCINVLPGTYRQTVTLRRGGNAANATGYVVLRSTQPLAARIIGPAGTYSAINLAADHLVVDGFDVTGAEGAGIDACLDSARGQHHLVVLNNRARDSGGSGISMCWGEYFHIEGNVTHGNSATNGYQTSGISIYQARAISGVDTPGFRNVVRNNVSYGNRITFACDRCHTDGNGIIIDDFQNGQVDAGPWKDVNYPHPTLVENNLAFDNGGKGIHVFVSDHVTVRHNTAWRNSTDLNFDGTWRAEMSNAFAANNTWVNNIAVTDSSISADNFAFLNAAGGDATNPGVTWSGNLAFDISPRRNLVRVDGAIGTLTAANGNLLGVDPGFLAASADPARADFRLDARSAARRVGLPTARPDTLNGDAAVGGDASDLGAY